MKQLYSFRKATMVLLVLVSNWAYAQSVCGPIVQNFDNTGNSMAGFTSSTENSTAPGFVYGQTGTNGYLEKCAIASPGTVYEIISATYQPFGTPTFVGYGFELSGAVSVSSITVDFQYIDNSNQVISVRDTIIANPAYTGTGANATFAVCDSFLLSRAVGFSPGEPYRIVIELTAASASNNNQCIVFDNFRASGTVAESPLPVAFTGFVAKKSGAYVDLVWNVAGEIDVLKYEVERSSNGRDFIRLGEVPANNASAYSFTDRQPLSSISFYRVKEIDIDGKFKYTTIFRINLNLTAILNAYPLPAKDQVTIEHAVTNKGILSISTADGRMVRQIDVKPQVGQTSINISNLKSGLYVIIFNNKGQTESIKLIKE